MRFFRVGYTQDHGSSAGFAWFTRKAEAEKACREWKAGGGEDLDCKIDVINFVSTRLGFLQCLNTWATHADNG